MKPLLMGSFGSKNIGDELILFASLQEHKKAMVMTANAKYSRNFCGYDISTVPPFPTGVRSFVRFLFNRQYRTSIMNLDTEVSEIRFPGGGLFAIKFAAVLHWGLVFLWIKVLFKNKKIILEYQSIDESLSFFSRLITRWCLSQVSEISVRDCNSKNSLISYGFQKEISVTPDRVEAYFSAKKNTKKTTKFSEYCVNFCRPVNLKTWKKVKASFFPQVNENGMTFVIMDPRDRECVPPNFRGKIIELQTQEEVVSLFSNTKMAVGERFHFLVLAKLFSNKYALPREGYAEKIHAYFGEKISR